jgi:hypothetical protein
MLQVRLNPGLRGGKWARLRPLCGADEALIDGEGSDDVVAFLDRLLARTPGTTVEPGRAADLAVCDCDRLCASIYLAYFGERIEGRIVCVACREPFEMEFSLPKLIENMARRPRSNVSGPDDEGVFTLSGGRRFRLPTAGEHQKVMEMGTDEALAALLSRCVVEGEPVDTAAIESAMDDVGATLDLDLDAACPHCAMRQTVRFDIQSYLFRALGYERQFLNCEAHYIAKAYGWTYEEILGLRREDRRAFVRLIQSDRPARRRIEL